MKVFDFLTRFLLLLCCFCALSSAKASALRLAPADADAAAPAIPEGAGDALDPWGRLRVCCVWLA